MKILVITQYYYPEQFRVTDVCEGLVKKGNEVTVVTGIPNYPEGEIFPGYEDSYKKEEVYNGVKIIRCNNEPRHKGIVKLFVNYISFVISANKVIENIDKDFDIVYVYQMSPITLALPAIKYKKLYGTPIYLFCMDLWPESIREISTNNIMSRYNPIYLFVKYLSIYIYTSVDCIGVKCNQFTNYLINVCKVHKNKINLLYEHAEEVYLKVNEFPDDNQCYDFMFLGNIGSAQHCELLVEALRNVKSTRKYKLHFVGDGSAIDDIKALVNKLGMNDFVVFHGRKPLGEIIEYYNLADCCLLTLSTRTDCGLTPPGKLYSYMAASRPIIAAAGGDSMTIINDNNCGICVGYGNINGLTEAMQYALDNEKEFQERGHNGREYFKKNFTLDKHIKELEKQIESLLYDE